MTFLYAPATLQYYFNALDSELTFAPAVQQVPLLMRAWRLHAALPCMALANLVRGAAKPAAQNLEWRAAPSRSHPRQFTHRVFGLPPQQFYSRHIVMLQARRGAAAG